MRISREIRVDDSSLKMKPTTQYLNKIINALHNCKILSLPFTLSIYLHATAIISFNISPLKRTTNKAKFLFPTNILKSICRREKEKNLFC